MEKIKQDLYEFRYVIIAVLMYLIIMQIIFSNMCPIKIIFGVDCPRMWPNTCNNLSCYGEIQRSNRSQLYSFWLVAANNITYNK